MATLKIYGDIGEEGITSEYVAEFLDQNKDATDITVRINSRGGDVSEGWAIHDLLVNSGKNITTIGEGKIYSIATIIFLAGTEREMMKNADGLIHNPYIPPFTLADAYESGDLLKIAEGLQQEEAKILDFYVERTGAPKDKLAEYMKEDTKLSAEDMLSLGFATRIIEPVKAFAYIKLNKNFIMDEKEVKSWGEKLDTIIASIKNFTRLTPADQTLKDKDGKEFKLEKESGVPAVGDKAAPDGSFTMADGKTVVILNGVVTEVKEPQVAKTDLEVANEKIVELQNQLDAEKTKVVDTEKIKTEVEAEKTVLETEKAKVVALATELQGLKNAWVPNSRTRFSTAEKVGDIDMNQVKEINKKLNKTE